ncbi:putative GDSL-like lipase/acylhydrolase [Actinoplanes missouriensis 431]|uniref:Putative GDSL-like lipase/acylhydrolase n=1 Tax=Actinoplanes missouriensis (strain ATCC 14538 / DSM 43046 / CBS 188.64 / JCM 3121 / NBRC 102363 / NCIMB 12654 / NRRL B-3342 / UNCC 431) TaxID=512565 RepID=I0GZ09_ACTM4|nr:SGNH/GDSL hydrolase family protein [Actinoplanes missouriensis]BAL85996.1 putative GDSL-like lipase/acylhydrolase [Actinoplanes missouriensis 431]
MAGLPKQVGRAAATGLLAGAVGGVALIAGELLAAKARRYAKPTMGLALRTSMGPATATPLRLVLLGDSAAVGVGVEWLSDTVGGQLARLLADGTPETGPRHVLLSSVGVAGSRSSDLGTQVARALLGDRPDVAVVLIGAYDATSGRVPEEAAIHLGQAVRRLRSAGVQVVVGTCPDLGATRSIAPPLRQIAGVVGRRMAKAQARAVVEAGGVVVDLAGETGAVFRADAGTLCYDGFHPSADGYRVWAHALYPAVAKAAMSGV